MTVKFLLQCQRLPSPAPVQPSLVIPPWQIHPVPALPIWLHCSSLPPALGHVKYVWYRTNLTQHSVWPVRHPNQGRKVQNLTSPAQTVLPHCSSRLLDPGHVKYVWYRTNLTQHSVWPVRHPNQGIKKQVGVRLFSYMNQAMTRQLL